MGGLSSEGVSVVPVWLVAVSPHHQVSQKCIAPVPNPQTSGSGFLRVGTASFCDKTFSFKVKFENSSGLAYSRKITMFPRCLTECLLESAPSKNVSFDKLA